VVDTEDIVDMEDKVNTEDIVDTEDKLDTEDKVDTEDIVDTADEAMSDDDDDDDDENSETDSDEDDEVDDAVRQEVKLALGDAAVHSDIEVSVLQIECDIFSRGSYFNVARTTMLHLFCRMTNH